MTHLSRPLTCLLLASLLVACEAKTPPAKPPESPADSPTTSDRVSNEPAMRALLAESKERVKRLYPAADRSGQAITIRYRSRLFDPPEEVKAVTRAEWNPVTPLEAFRGWLPAFLSGDVDWIVSIFAPAEQEEIRKRAEDPEQLRKNTEFFRQVKQINVREIVLWGNYAVIVFEHRLAGDVSLARPATYVEIDGKWHLTNEAGKNPFFSEVLAVLEKEGDEVERVK